MLYRGRASALTAFCLCVAPSLCTLSCISRELETAVQCQAGEPRCDDAHDGGDAHDGATDGGDALSGDSACADCDAAQAGPCTPGHYVGRHDMPSYKPAAAGLCGIVPLFGGGSTGSWEFSLDGDVDSGTLLIDGRVACVSLTVDTADGGSAAPLDGGLAGSVIALSGTVQCETGHMEGELRAVYRSISVCDSSNAEDFSVKGFVSAEFDRERRAFVDGVVDLREPSLIPGTGGFGGVGTWWAARVGPVLVPDGGCEVQGRFVDFSVGP